jgi:hypothetical protein
MMLILAFIAICVACVLLWFELKQYDPFPWWKTEGVAPATSSVHTPGAVDTGWSAAVQWLRA